MRRVLTDNTINIAGPLKHPTVIIGIRPGSADEHGERIANRDDQMLDGGLYNEVHDLCERHRRAPATLNSIGYEEWAPHFQGTCTLDQVRTAIIDNTVKYAAGQQAWLGTWDSIHWADNPEQAADIYHNAIATTPAP